MNVRETIHLNCITVVFMVLNHVQRLPAMVHRSLILLQWNTPTKQYLLKGGSDLNAKGITNL